MEHHVGSELDTCIYEPNEEATHNLIKFQIAESLNAQEPRIEVSKDNITLTDDGVTVYANIIYTLKAYNTTHVYNTRIGGVDNENQ